MLPSLLSLEFPAVAFLHAVAFLPAVAGVAVTGVPAVAGILFVAESQVRKQDAPCLKALHWNLVNPLRRPCPL